MNVKTTLLSLAICIVVMAFSQPAPALTTEILVDSGQRLGDASTYAVAVGDLDGDGDLDAFNANGWNRSLPDEVWLNDGSGFFSNGFQNLGPASDSRVVALGDLNDDGYLDAIVGGQENRLFLNLGSTPEDGWLGLFDTGQALHDGWIHGIALGDFDADGDLDAFFGTAAGGRVCLNNGAGLLGISQDVGLGAQWGRPAVGDLDGDNDLDIVYGDAGHVLLNTGGIFERSQTLNVPDFAVQHRLGDVDSDGDLDLFVFLIGSNNILYLNDGDGSLGDPIDILQDATRYGELGDLDLDGDLDRIGIRENYINPIVRLNDGLGDYTIVSTQTFYNTCWDVALGDYDGDGDLDAFFGIGTSSGKANEVWFNQILDGPVDIDGDGEPDNPVPAENQPPVADAGADQRIKQNVPGDVLVTLDGSLSSDPDGDELDYLWTWSIADVDYEAAGVGPVIALPPGIHTIGLEVSDGLETDIDSVEIEVHNAPPVANAGGNQALSGCTAEAALDGSQSDDPDNDPISFRWFYADTEFATVAAPTITLAGLGDHIITLIVNDGVVDSSPDDVVISLVDDEAPSIFCPDDTTVDAFDTSGVPKTDPSVDAFLKAAYATDTCDDDVDIHNDAPAVLPIGTTVITFTATDDSGNSSNCQALLTIAGPQDITAAVPALLVDAKTGDKKIDKNIDNAIKSINKSLGGGKHDLWLDELHLDPKRGRKVFGEQKKAVDKLLSVINKSDASDEVKEQLQEIIDRLVTANHLLAIIALDEAIEIYNQITAPRAQKKAEREIDKANEALAEAYTALDNGEPNKTIDKFKKVWEHAQKAIAAGNAR